MEEYNTQKTPQPNKRIIIYAAIALTMIAAGALAFILLNNNRKPVVLAPMATPPPEKAVTQAAPPPLPTAKTITQAPSPTPAPPGQPTQPPPQEVLDFLKDVEAIEQNRRFLLNDKGPALALLAGGGDALESMIRQAMDPSLTENIDPFVKVRTELSRQLNHWQQVLKSFDTLKPPASCRQFAGAYRWVLATEAQQIGKAASILANVRADERDSMSRALSALNNMKADPTTQGSIDRAVDASEAQLDALCKQYGIAKPFSVYKESGGGSILLPR